jgi:hypothetical protein
MHAQDMRKMIVLAASCVIATHAAARDGCVRGEPAPLFPKAASGMHSFTPKSPTEADETLRLPSGATLRVEHGGCEYYVLTFEFPGAAKENAYASAARLVDSLRLQQPESVFDLQRAASTLRAMASKGEPLGKEEEVAGDGEDFLQTRLMLEQRKGKLRLTLFVGPL